MIKRFFSSTPFTILTGIVGREQFTQQTIMSYDGTATNGLLTGSPTPCTVDITIADAGFIASGPSTIYIGGMSLSTGVEWSPTEGDVNATATSLAAAIDNLPGFSATALAAVVTVEGPVGPSVVPIRVVYEGAGGNYTLSPDTDTISGEPEIGPPEIG